MVKYSYRSLHQVKKANIKTTGIPFNEIYSNWPIKIFSIVIIMIILDISVLSIKSKYKNELVSNVHIKKGKVTFTPLGQKNTRESISFNDSINRSGQKSSHYSQNSNVKPPFNQGPATDNPFESRTNPPLGTMFSPAYPSSFIAPYDPSYDRINLPKESTNFDNAFKDNEIKDTDNNILSVEELKYIRKYIDDEEFLKPDYDIHRKIFLKIFAEIKKIKIWIFYKKKWATLQRKHPPKIT